jgi:DNA-binding XRE family transcriptional regulator
VDSQQLKQARLTLGYTQKQLAEALGLHTVTIAHMEMPSNHGRYPVKDWVARTLSHWMRMKAKKEAQ